jgi:hypothetical protein
MAIFNSNATFMTNIGFQEKKPIFPQKNGENRRQW